MSGFARRVVQDPAEWHWLHCSFCGRFREAVMQKSEARQLLIDYWMGHENDDMSTRYGKQLLEDVKYRKEWAEKIGFGFSLPTSKPVLIGLRGLQNAGSVVAA